jgi:SpoVK/Ycf46/Vps4 family AAA+-type ATPase
VVEIVLSCLFINPFQKHKMKELDNIKTWLAQDLQSQMKQQKEGRGKGFLALFKGADKGAKTKAAESLVQQSGKELYSVNVSQIVGKYIGETEKNLSAVLKNAEGKNWILFFDEADALFDKRTSVRDSHDRYANRKIDYLLQKAESYEGLVILSAKAKQNLDDAFKRRFRAVVCFP